MSPHSPLRTPGAVSLRIRPPLCPPPAALERISLPQTLPVATLEDSTVRKCALRTEHTVPGASSSGRGRASLPFNHNRVLRAIDDLDGWGGWIGDDWRRNSMYEVPVQIRSTMPRTSPTPPPHVLLTPVVRWARRHSPATPRAPTLPYHITPPFELSPPKEPRIRILRPRKRRGRYSRLSASSQVRIRTYVLRFWTNDAPYIYKIRSSPHRQSRTTHDSPRSSGSPYRDKVPSSWTYPRARSFRSASLTIPAHRRQLYSLIAFFMSWIDAIMALQSPNAALQSVKSGDESKLRRFVGKWPPLPRRYPRTIKFAPQVHVVVLSTLPNFGKRRIRRRLGDPSPAGQLSTFRAPIFYLRRLQFQFLFSSRTMCPARQCPSSAVVITHPFFLQPSPVNFSHLHCQCPTGCSFTPRSKMRF
ncbi:hypothetical protein C8J57DRAFT_1728947 [Mycena rebaudengoi]|nr:hypothetical protein C8J57DRAFT_1728947 [Mycena rebaudengoi]